MEKLEKREIHQAFFVSFGHFASERRKSIPHIAFLFRRHLSVLLASLVSPFEKQKLTLFLFHEFLLVFSCKEKFAIKNWLHTNYIACLSRSPPAADYALAMPVLTAYFPVLA